MTVFLDLPNPWLAIENAKKALKVTPSRVLSSFFFFFFFSSFFFLPSFFFPFFFFHTTRAKLCSFSPCMEQVQRTCAKLTESGFIGTVKPLTTPKNTQCCVKARRKKKQAKEPENLPSSIILILFYSSFFILLSSSSSVVDVYTIECVERTSDVRSQAFQQFSFFSDRAPAPPGPRKV